MGIDVGIINMGVVQMVVDENFDFHFDTAFRYDITHVRHTKVKPCDCTIPHTNEIVDRVCHFTQENQDMLDDADLILVERQPIMGLTNIEALLMYMFRNKIKLISPNRMHKHFGINHLDYEERKGATTSIAELHLSHLPGFTGQVRQHDMGDACCMCLFQVKKLKDERLKKIRLEGIKRLPFDEYAFIPGRGI